MFEKKIKAPWEKIPPHKLLRPPPAPFSAYGKNGLLAAAPFNFKRLGGEKNIIKTKQKFKLFGGKRGPQQGVFLPRAAHSRTSPVGPLKPRTLTPQ